MSLFPEPVTYMYTKINFVHFQKYFCSFAEDLLLLGEVLLAEERHFGEFSHCESEN